MIQVYRNGAEHITFKSDDLRLKQQFLGTETVSGSFDSNVFIDLEIGDYIVWNNQNFYLNQPAGIIKMSSNSFRYDVIFESMLYELGKVQFQSIDLTGIVDGETDFYLMGDLEMFGQLLVDNMNRVYSGWVLGDVLVVEPKNLSFSKDTCLSALNKIYSEFEVEFDITNKELKLKQIGIDTALSFEYGQGKGLYEVERKRSSDENIVTRLFGFGSTKNLGTNYRDFSRRLRLISNKIEKAGFCDDLTQWQIIAGAPTIEPDFNYGTGSIKLNQGDILRYSLVDKLIYGRKYIAIFNSKNNESCYPKIVCNGNTFLADDSTEWNKAGGKFEYLEANPHWIDVSINTYQSTNKAWFDAISIIEITDEEYNLSDAELIDKYNFYKYNTIEKNVDNYGVIEHSEIFEDIYPHREGIVSGIDSHNELYFYDDSLTFDVNNQLMQGVSAKVHFNTGNLAGFEFEISKYDNVNKKFYLIPIDSDYGYVMPNATLKPSVGDKYVLIDIIMPIDYILEAESQLYFKSLEYLDNNCDPKVSYGVKFDNRYLRKNAIDLEVGNYVTIIDTHFNINRLIRINEISQNLSDPFDIEIELADTLEPTFIQRLYEEQLNAAELARISDLGNIQKARRNWKSVQELKNMVFDTDDYFDTDNIRPKSIETGMLSVGSKSTQFLLKDITIEANFTGDKSKVYISSGELVHLAIDEDIKTWSIFTNYYENLIDETSYYIYAKCSISDYVNLNNKIIIDTAQKKVDVYDGNYYFLIGILHSVVDNVRAISLTYGHTTINGKFITTGKIQSQDGETSFDLDQGFISGTIQFGVNSSGYNNLTDKPDLSVYALGSYVDSVKADLQNQIDGNITSWFYNGVPTLVNDPAVNWTTTELKDKHLNDLYYDKNTYKGYRFVNESGYKWVIIQDTELTAALAAASEAQDTADGKRRVFVVTPTTPYDVGDLWTNGSDLRKCKTARASGSYYSSDWELATDYDQTSTVIAGGLVTTGRLVVKSGDNIERGGINGNASSGSSEIGIWLGATYAGRASAPFRVNHAGVLSAVSGTIGGWTLASDAIYTGTKDTTGYTSSGITLASNGSVNSVNFRINSLGNLFIKNLSVEGVISIGTYLRISNLYGFYCPGTTSSAHDSLFINYDGASYQTGVIIGNGKGDKFIQFDPGFWYGDSLNYVRMYKIPRGNIDVSPIGAWKQLYIDTVSGLIVRES